MVTFRSNKVHLLYLKMSEFIIYNYYLSPLTTSWCVLFLDTSYMVCPSGVCPSKWSNFDTLFHSGPLYCCQFSVAVTRWTQST